MFLTIDARGAFAKLTQTFVEAPILNHFDPKCHIRIETNASDNAIGQTFSQLTSDDLSQWHPVAFVSKKMI